MIKRILIAVATSTLLLPQAVSAYDPDGFHHCMLENLREGMSNAAVLAVRQSCAYLHNTTINGNRPPPPIAEDSHINAFKKEHGAELSSDPACRYPRTIDDCIVSAFRDAWYPTRSLEEVRGWLYRSQEEYGPMPPIDSQ